MVVFNSRTLNLIRDRCVVVCGFLFDISDELYADLHRSQFLDEQLASVWNSDLDYISFAQISIRAFVFIRSHVGNRHETTFTTDVNSVAVGNVTKSFF
jgi:hypothetical protein